MNKSPSAVVLEIGLQKSTVTRWKNGSIPTDATALKIADYFGVTVDNLLGNEQKETPALTKEDERDINFDDFTYAFLDETKELTEENKAKLLEMAKFFKQQQDREKNT